MLWYMTSCFNCCCIWECAWLCWCFCISTAARASARLKIPSFSPENMSPWKERRIKILCQTEKICHPREKKQSLILIKAKRWPWTFILFTQWHKLRVISFRQCDLYFVYLNTRRMCYVYQGCPRGILDIEDINKIKIYLLFFHLLCRKLDNLFSFLAGSQCYTTQPSFATVIEIQFSRGHFSISTILSSERDW